MVPFCAEIIVPGIDASTRSTNVKPLAYAGIVAGVLGVAWNLVSIAGVSLAYAEYRERAQDRAAVEEAARSPRPSATEPTTVIVVPAQPAPATVTIGIALCVIIFILNTALAFELLAASGLLPRRPERAWPLLRLYVTAKPPAAVLAGVAWWWLLRLAFDRTDVAHVAVAVAVAAIGWAYPMFLGAFVRRAGVAGASTQRGGKR